MTPLPLLSSSLLQLHGGGGSHEPHNTNHPPRSNRKLLVEWHHDDREDRCVSALSSGTSTCNNNNLSGSASVAAMSSNSAPRLFLRRSHQAVPAKASSRLGAVPLVVVTPNASRNAPMNRNSNHPIAGSNDRDGSTEDSDSAAAAAAAMIADLQAELSSRTDQCLALQETVLQLSQQLTELETALNKRTATLEQYQLQYQAYCSYGATTSPKPAGHSADSESGSNSNRSNKDRWDLGGGLDGFGASPVDSHDDSDVFAAQLDPRKPMLSVLDETTAGDACAIGKMSYKSITNCSSSSAAVKTRAYAPAAVSRRRTASEGVEITNKRSASLLNENKVAQTDTATFTTQVSKIQDNAISISSTTPVTAPSSEGRASATSTANPNPKDPAIETTRLEPAVLVEANPRNLHGQEVGDVPLADTSTTLVSPPFREEPTATLPPSPAPEDSLPATDVLAAPRQAAFYQVILERDVAQRRAYSLWKELKSIKEQNQRLHAELRKSTAMLEIAYSSNTASADLCESVSGDECSLSATSVSHCKTGTKIGQLMIKPNRGLATSRKPMVALPHPLKQVVVDDDDSHLGANQDCPHHRKRGRTLSFKASTLRQASTNKTASTTTPFVHPTSSSSLPSDSPTLLVDWKHDNNNRLNDVLDRSCQAPHTRDDTNAKTTPSANNGHDYATSLSNRSTDSTAGTFSSFDTLEQDAPSLMDANDGNAVAQADPADHAAGGCVAASAPLPLLGVPRKSVLYKNNAVVMIGRTKLRVPVSFEHSFERVEV